MQQATLDIAGWAISFEAPRLTLEKPFHSFLSQKKPRLRVRTVFREAPRFRKKELLYRKGKSFRFYRTERGFLIETESRAFREEFQGVYRHAPPNGIPRAVLLDPSLKKAILFSGVNKRNGVSFHLIWPYFYLLMSHLLLVRKEGFFIHAAGVYDRGRGYLFVGPSGAGKSTLAYFFRKHVRGSLLGDDFMVIHKKAGRPLIYATPLFRIPPSFPSGEGAPLRGIFFLTHGRRNRLKALPLQESLRRFLSETPPIFWVPEGLSFAAAFSLDLCRSIPTYELSFRPDGQVVPFLRKALLARG